MSAAEWRTYWFEMGRLQEWLAGPVGRKDGALVGITAAPYYGPDREMLDHLLRIAGGDGEEVVLRALAVDDDVWVYVRGEEVVVVKEHEFRPVEEHRFELLARAEFLRWLTFLEQVKKMPLRADAVPPANIFVESVPISREDVARFIDESG